VLGALLALGCGDRVKGGDHDPAGEAASGGVGSTEGGASTDRGGAVENGPEIAGTPPVCKTDEPCGSCGTACYSTQICVDGSCRCPTGEVSSPLDLPGGPVYCRSDSCPPCGADADCQAWGCDNGFDTRIVIGETEALAFEAYCNPMEEHPDAPLLLSTRPIATLELATGYSRERDNPCPDLAVTGWVETPEGPYVACSDCESRSELHLPDGSAERITGRALTLLRTGAEELLLAVERKEYSGRTATLTLLSTTASARQELDCPCTSASPIAADASAVYCYDDAVFRCERDGSAPPLELVRVRPTQLAVADGFLYFDTLTRLRRIPVTGGESEVVAENPRRFAVAPSGWVVFTGSADEVLAVRPGDGSEPVVLRPSPVSPRAVATAVAANDALALVYDRDGLTAIPLPQ